MNKVYTPSSYFVSLRDAQNCIRKMSRITAGYEEEKRLKELSFDELDLLIYLAEKLALSCRNIVEIKEKTKEDPAAGRTVFETENHGVTVEFDEKTLRIRTPFTFKRFYRDGSLKENYILMNYVRAGIKRWQNEHHTDLFYALRPPLTMLILRKGPSYERSKICDNDNLENGRIVNEIVEALGCSDNALCLDLFSGFRIVRDEKDYGMEFVLFSSNELKEHLDELRPCM